MIFTDLFPALLYLLNALISEGHQFANTPAVPSSSPNSEKGAEEQLYLIYLFKYLSFSKNASPKLFLNIYSI
jgi:hypothetical protein